MPVFKCKNCIPINVPDNWTTEKKIEVANLVRKHGKLKSIMLSDSFGLDLGSAKQISFHVSEKKGICRCRTELKGYEGQCSNCGRLNLDW